MPHVVINDGWSIPLQQTVKQLEVIREVVLSEVSKPNDLECKEQKIREWRSVAGYIARL